MLKFITKVASATFPLMLFTACGANAESRLPPCPEDRNLVWNNCHGTATLSDGRKYVGEWKDGKINGQGTYTAPDGSKYVGEWKDNKRNGQGTYTWPNGDEYVGEWKDNKRNGQGTDTWPNGDEYVGEFKDGEFNGQGTYTRSNGEKYVGEFKDGKFNGQGTYTWSNGEKYVGEWKDNKSNGHGTLYSYDGSVRQSGISKDDKLVESSTENSSNKATTSALGLPELALILIVGGITILAAIFLTKDRTEASIRVSSPTAATKVPATELEGAQRPQQPEQVEQPSPTSVSQAKMENELENGPRPVSDAEMVAWRASLDESPYSVAKAELHVDSPLRVGGTKFPLLFAFGAFFFLMSVLIAIGEMEPYGSKAHIIADKALQGGATWGVLGAAAVLIRALWDAIKGALVVTPEVLRKRKNSK